MNSDTEAWFAKLTDAQRDIADTLRALVHSNSDGLREEVKWNQPCFIGKSMVCYIQKAKTHVSLGFAKGAKMTDPQALLEGEGGQMRHVKVLLGTSIDVPVVSELIKEAVALDG